jgi:tetratricopeptide (TPR) repeat protein
MKVSNSFYLSFWLKNTLMAFATGALIGLFSSQIIIIYSIPVNIIIGACLAIVLYQISAYIKFFGKRRGEFEYDFKVELIEKKVKALVFRHLGIFQYVRYLSDGLNNISTAQGELCKRLIAIVSDEDKYFIYMKISLLENKNDDLEKEISFLKSALEKNDKDLIANYRLAVCLELNKDAESAIKHYHQALTDTSIDSVELKDFIKLQIERVNSKGPLNKPPALGLRYTSW